MMKLAGLYTLIGCGLAFGAANQPIPAKEYLARLQKVVAQSRSRLPHITLSAERAARNFVNGGKIWAAGRQIDFIDEACGRAGGLMSIAPLDVKSPAVHDIVLYAVPENLNDDDIRLISSWSKTGAYVVAFAQMAKKAAPITLIESCDPADSVGLAVLVDQQKKLCPVDTVANVINLWTWTAEFASACTRLGIMPVFYKRFGLPGGPERGKKYAGKIFHDDMKIQPIAPGTLAKAYLDKIDFCLAELQRTGLPRLIKAAQWWRSTPSASTTVLVIGHMFPRNFLDARAPQFGDFASAPAWTDKELYDKKNPRAFIFYVGYQYAPNKFVAQAKIEKFKLAYVSAQSAQPEEAAENVLYINPGWPLDDACVKVPGYDVPILPASGVIDAAIYWAALAQRCDSK